jgi:hypothetical protein
MSEVCRLGSHKSVGAALVGGQNGRPMAPALMGSKSPKLRQVCGETPTDRGATTPISLRKTEYVLVAQQLTETGDLIALYLAMSIGSAYISSFYLQPTRRHLHEMILHCGSWNKRSPGEL